MNNRPNFLAAGPAAEPVPYPPFPPIARAVIVDAVVAAWDDVKSTPAAKSIPPHEVPITLELQRRLNAMLNDDTIPGFSASIFETVIRGGEVENATASSLERTPDLTFRLQGKSPARTAREHYALFTECKVVDSTRTVDGYCKSGLRRFTTSEYAWKMSHAMMVAYAAEGSTHQALGDFLDGNTDYTTLGAPVINVLPPPTLTSSHERTIAGSPSSCGPIEITHVWLALDQQ